MREKKTGRAKAVGIIVILTLLGKVLGLVRDMLLGHSFATGIASTAFLTASRIPRNFFDAIFASAISASFIPVFNEYLEKKGREEAFRLSNAFITIVSLAAAVMSALGILFAAPLTAFLADGFDVPTAALCAALLRVLFPTILFTGVAFSMVGILQSLDEFNVPALLSTVSNGVILLYYAFFCDRFGIMGLAVAFLIGWAMQVAVQVPSLHRCGYRYRPQLYHEGIKKIFTLMLSVMVSTWVQPLNLTVATKFASRLNGGAAAAAMEYANTLYTIVAGVFVLSIANVIFPELSRLSVREDSAELDSSLCETLRAMLFLLAPMAAGLSALAQPIVRLLYDWGKWDAQSTDLTSRALMYLSLGMIGYGVQIILSRAYYAAQKGSVPLLAGAASVAVNYALCRALYGTMGIEGLALASAAAALLSALVLWLALGRTHPALLGRELIVEFIKIYLCAKVMGLLVQQISALLPALLTSDGVAARVVAVAVPTAVGVIAYFALTWLCRVRVLREAREMLGKRGESR